MTDEQETPIYDALIAGDQDAAERLREAAYAADQARPEDAPEGWLSPAQQFDVDHAAAWARYQAENEASEQDRVANARRLVAQENEEAPKRG